VAISHPRRPLNSATVVFIGMLSEQMRARTRKGRAQQEHGAA
jgi:hypothetical protein